MKVEIDRQADSAYITLVNAIKRGEAVQQVLADSFILDLDSAGRLLGIEVLDTSALHPDLQKLAEG